MSILRLYVQLGLDDHMTETHVLLLHSRDGGRGTTTTRVADCTYISLLTNVLYVLLLTHIFVLIYE